MQYLYHVLSLREPVFIRPAELGGIQQVFFIKRPRITNSNRAYFPKMLGRGVQEGTNKVPMRPSDSKL
jgi:hypothetical protein